MVRVDFYILGETSREPPQQVACRIAEKAWLMGHRVFIATGSETMSQRLDTLLWTYRQDSFTPHGIYPGQSGDELPILIGDRDAPPDAEVLINLSDAVPPFHERFARITEFVGKDEASRRAGRDRFRFYRDRGYDLHTHNL